MKYFENKRRLIEVLKKNGIDRVVITYAGYGDSGGIEDFDGLEGVEPSNIMLFCLNEKDEEVNCNLNTALENLLWDVIEMSGHAGFENNDGGGGELLIDVETGNIYLDHYYNITERDYHEHVL